MKKTILFVACIFLSSLIFAEDIDTNHSVIKSYSKEFSSNIKLPVGGIGTGTVSLRGDGALVDWEVMDRPAKGFQAGMDMTGEVGMFPFFALFYQEKGQQGEAVALQADPAYSNYEGDEGSHFPGHALPKFGYSKFKAGYPFGSVLLSDSNRPVEACITAWNPMIPGNADDSGYPVMVLEYSIKNKSDSELKLAVCGNVPNFSGVDSNDFNISWKGEKNYKSIGKRVNSFREDGILKGLFMDLKGGKRNYPTKGNLSLTTDSDGTLSYRTDWMRFNGWGDHLVDFWDDLKNDGVLNNKSGKNDRPMASLAVAKSVAPGETAVFRFYISWYFPNRLTWTPGKVWSDYNFYQKKSRLIHDYQVIGNYYTTKFKDSFDAAKQLSSRVGNLRADTTLFVKAVADSDYPESFKEAALFNASTLRTQTVFRLPDGKLFGWEGCMDTVGSCLGSCTHVWNYEQTVPFLYGDLAKTMRDVEFNYATGTNGGMSFRVGLPLEGLPHQRRAQIWKIYAADGQMGTISRFYREWKMSGDDEFLKRSWKNVKNALAFAWNGSGWDCDADGFMEGKQHNTMDIEYYGPNPEIQFWYLAALKSGAEMADYLGDDEFRKKCQQLFESGVKKTEEILFNGEYFEHKITPGKEHMRYQIGEGCMTDQLVGQFIGKINGFDNFVDEDQVNSALKSIWKYNHRDRLTDNASFYRTYALGDDAGLIVAGFPKSRPQFPFPYFAEVWSGLEYSAAASMIYQGMDDYAVQIVNDIRNRHDGRKRNPFNEPECGNHYARAMAAWGLLPAWVGFEFSAVDKSISFSTQHKGKFFWSNGYSWGTVKLEDSEVVIDLLHGELNLEEVVVDDVQYSENWKALKGETITVNLK